MGWKHYVGADQQKCSDARVQGKRALEQLTKRKSRRSAWTVVPIQSVAALGGREGSTQIDARAQ